MTNTIDWKKGKSFVIYSCNVHVHKSDHFSILYMQKSYCCTYMVIVKSRVKFVTFMALSSVGFLESL